MPHGNTDSSRLADAIQQTHSMKQIHYHYSAGGGESIVVETTAFNSHRAPDYPLALIFKSDHWRKGQGPTPSVVVGTRKRIFRLFNQWADLG